jgi:hypothetical protein
MLRNLTKVVCAGAMLAATQVSLAQETRPILTQATPKKMADAYEQFARDKGWKIIVAIRSLRGTDLRMPGAPSWICAFPCVLASPCSRLW